MKVMCYLCKEKEEKAEMEQYEGKNFHKSCCLEYKAKREIYKYVAKIFKFKSETNPGPRINNQLKLFIQKGYTYKGILNSLLYFFDIKKSSIKKANEGIGIVPYVYEEAQEYYKNLEKKQQNIANTIEKQINIKPVILEIREKEEKKKRKIFDIDEL